MQTTYIFRLKTTSDGFHIISSCWAPQVYLVTWTLFRRCNHNSLFLLNVILKNPRAQLTLRDERALDKNKWEQFSLSGKHFISNNWLVNPKCASGWCACPNLWVGPQSTALSQNWMGTCQTGNITQVIGTKLQAGFPNCGREGSH